MLKLPIEAFLPMDFPADRSVLEEVAALPRQQRREFRRTLRLSVREQQEIEARRATFGLTYRDIDGALVIGSGNTPSMSLPAEFDTDMLTDVEFFSLVDLGLLGYESMTVEQYNRYEEVKRRYGKGAKGILVATKGVLEKIVDMGNAELEQTRGMSDEGYKSWTRGVIGARLSRKVLEGLKKRD